MTIRYATNPLEAKNYGSLTLHAYTRVGAGSTITSDFIDCREDKTKTLGFYSTSRGTAYVDVSQIGTANIKQCLGSRVSPGSFAHITFEDIFKYARTRIRCGGAGSAIVTYAGRWL